jgi:hypothetical protein
MESNRELEANNVFSLDEQRRLRVQREAEQEAPEPQVESIGDMRCEGGVCQLNWSPKKKTA